MNSTLLELKDLNDDLIRQLAGDSILFANRVIDFQPYWYQEKVLQDPSRFIIICWGRQLGKSDVVAVKALHYAATHANCLVLIVSPRLRQSKIIYYKIRSFIVNSPILRHEAVKIVQEEIELKNGARIANIPVGGSMGDALRGFAVNLLIVDEAARVPQTVFTSAIPMLAATYGSIILISTPAGKSGFFWQCWNDPTYSKYHLTFEAGLAVTNPKTGQAQIDPALVEKERATKTPWEFAQEYCAEFVDEFGVFFPGDVIDKATDLACTYSSMTAYSRLEGEPGKTYTAGIDFAKHVDTTALSILEKDPQKDVWNQVFVQTWGNVNYDSQLKQINEICHRFNVTRIYADQTSVGEVPVDLLMNTYGWGGAVEGVQCYSRQTKVDMLSNMLAMLSSGRLHLLNWPDFTRELKSIARSATPEGKLKIEAPGGLHDDRTVATGLSALMGRLPTPSVAVVTVKASDYRAALHERNENLVSRLDRPF